MNNPLLAANQMLSGGTFESPGSVQRTASEVVQKAQPTLSQTIQQGGQSPNYNLIREDLIKKVTKNTDRIQGLRDQIYEGLRQKALIQAVPPEMQQMSHEEALRTGGMAMALRSMGVRDQFIQPAVGQYVDTRNQQFAQENAMNMAQAEQQAQMQRGVMDAELAGLQGQVQDVQAENKFYAERIDAIDSYLEEELTQAGLDRRAMLTYKRMVDVEKMRSDSRIAIEQFKDDGAERMRLRDAAEQILTRQAETNLGRPLNPEEQKDIIERAGFMALSDKYLEYARMLGVEADTNYTQARTQTENELRPGKVAELSGKVKLLQQEYKFNEQMNPQKLEKIAEDIKASVQRRTESRARIERAKEASERASKAMDTASNTRKAALLTTTISEQKKLVADLVKEAKDVEQDIRSLQEKLAKANADGDEELAQFYTKAIEEDRKRLQDLYRDRDLEKQMLKTYQDLSNTPQADGNAPLNPMLSGPISINRNR